MKMRTEEFDPEVYEFYRAALEGPGFHANTDNLNIELMRENEIRGHALHLDPYDVYAKRNITAVREDGDEMWLRVYVPEAARKSEKALPVILYFHGGGNCASRIVSYGACVFYSVCTYTKKR
jgi:dipeptidyl aminopeptidase/acylaminoacyl peptidase